MTTENNRKRIRKLVYISLFTAAASMLSQFSFPLPSGVPLTLQTFSVCLAGYFLGRTEGFASVLLYISLGLCGAPVFYGFSGGFHHLAGPTGGFLAGFLILAFLCGIGRSGRRTSGIFLGITGIFVCHFLGILWYSYASGCTLMTAFVSASAFFLPKDIASAVGAYFAAGYMKKYLKY